MKCEDCNGRGFNETEHRRKNPAMPWRTMSITHNCATCYGTGMTPESYLRACQEAPV